MTDALAALHASSDRLRQLVGGLDPVELRGPAYPTEWTVADVLSHLGSSAVIFTAGFDAAAAGREPEVDQHAIWDAWNAKAPDTQVTDGLAADRGLLDRLDTLPAAARSGFRFPMGAIAFDFDGFVGLRLNEHTLHTWDVAVALDPRATLLPEAVPFVLDGVGLIARFTGKPSEAEAVHVRTSHPHRDVTIVLGPDAVSIAPSTDRDARDLELPAEALIRLLYGRLDPDHTPEVSDPDAVARLRAVFPGP
jgi:uncharacterized protein (TIGR03083 family)